ncbi:MAG: serine/threonine protein kinase, partial [Planctomycetes bacterium]|nr:serine/threonine protein kinase [Planctomycetota bacterium]
MGMLAADPSSARPFVDRIGEFAILRRLGHGGMGVVFLARQESVDRLVAIKVLHPQYSANAQLSARFRREAQAIARLNHPHIVRVLDYGQDQGLAYIAMEYVPGRGLDEVIAAGGIDTRQAILWARDVARALHTSHEQSILHRDVKPSNIRITRDGRAMLLDFGLAKALDAATLTFSSTFQGSPCYASPEQISRDHGAIGPATDVYSLAVTLYEAVTGQVPFSGETTEQMFRAILESHVTRLRAHTPQLPRDLETVVAKAMEREPERRYASAAEFADDLDAILTLRPVRARPVGMLGRTWRWVRRNQTAAAGVAVAVLALVSIPIVFAVDRAT